MSLAVAERVRRGGRLVESTKLRMMPAGSPPALTEVRIMRILIAYDGSAGAEQSLRLADSIDWPADSTLRIAA